MTNPQLPESLLRYLDTRAKQRGDAVKARLDSLTHRERRLVREAAVMGYVLGSRRASGATIPRDSAIVADVVAHCQSTSNLYPVIGDAPRELIRQMVRQHGPISRDAVVEAAAELMATLASSLARTVDGMVDDGLLAITDGKLTTGPED